MAKDVIFDSSVATLKKTIPLMMKYNVPVNPVNYALWYTYASNEVPTLNKELDSAIKLYNTCPQFRADQLYDKHVSTEKDEQSKGLQKSIESMISKLSESIGSSKKNAKEFENAMDFCHDELSGMDGKNVSQDNVAGFVSELVAKSQIMRDSAKSFGNSLIQAQREIKSLRAKLADSQQAALYDALTGLLNRRAFDQEIESLLALPDMDMCLIIADIDHFKKFNDTHGHLLGDQVLKFVAKRLAAASADGAMAFRFGGEEFIILVPKGSLLQAHSLAELIRLSIERLKIKDKKTGEVVANITCSFGVAELDKEMDATALVNLADERLYSAKQQGRNRVHSQ